MDLDLDSSGQWLEHFVSAHPGGGAGELRRWARQQPDLAGDEQRIERLVLLLRNLELVRGVLDPDQGSAMPTLRRRQGGPSAGPASLRPLEAGRRIGDFVLLRFVASGGMGQVWEAEDEVLRRRVALKLVLPEHVDERGLALFTREARAGGRIQHPNLVTTLAHGTDDGLAWIAQELVEGSWTLQDSLEAVRAEETVPKGYYREVAELVARVADGMQAAHDAGVIHRDLKPRNILIDEADRPKVTDFGLARVSDDSFPSHTGELGGTWAYMSPEQVTAKRMGLDHRTDVFSLGVVLYELLTLRRPFEGDTTQQIAARIIGVDPPDASRVRSQCPRELGVVCGKALEKHPDRRYATMAEFAADLRRHLAGEPVLARPPGPIVRAAKWLRRHPAVSAVAGVVALALLVVSSLSLDLAATAEDLAAANDSLGEEKRRAQESASLAEQRARENAELARVATRRADDVLSLSSAEDLDDLVAEAELLWPPHPRLLERYERWLADARALREGRAGDEAAGLRRRPALAEHEARLAELQARAVPEEDELLLERARSHGSYPDLERARAELELRRRLREGLAWPESGPAVLPDGESGAGSEPEREAPQELRARWEGESPAERERELARLEQRVLGLEIEVGERRIEDPQESWWQRQLAALVAGIRALHDPESGLASHAVGRPFGWGVARRAEFARGIAERSVEGREARERWSDAIEGIASSPRYGGLRIEPVLGLLPLGPDPRSGLWEFAHLQSGEPARRDEQGALEVTEETGIVLVLIPGGDFVMGAQSADPEGPNHDPAATEREGPPHRVDLSPFLLSKYEMTQGQWERATGSRPSYYQGGAYGADLRHPVEQVSWNECMEVLGRLDLTLPTEAWWEYGCRAGSDTPWWPGRDREAIRGKVNLADGTAAEAGAPWPVIQEWPDHHDGGVVHREVGAYPANAFGLHEVHGNVWEWCRDAQDPAGYPEAPRRDPWIGPEVSDTRVFRGGSFNSPARYCRSSTRRDNSPDNRGSYLGLRPSRGLGASAHD